jgi:hypothetical protein
MSTISSVSRVGTTEPLKIPSKTDMQIRAIADSDNNFVSGTYQGVLIQE